MCKSTFSVSELENVLKSISGDEFLNKFGKPKPDKNTPIIFSCRSGVRSATAQTIAQQLGYEK